MTDNFPRYDRLPEQMQNDARRYIEQGKLWSDFLLAVVENDLVNVFGRADNRNREALNDWTMWLYNDIPQGAWGSKEAVEEWREMGGLEGKHESDS